MYSHMEGVVVCHGTPLRVLLVHVVFMFGALVAGDVASVWER